MVPLVIPWHIKYIDIEYINEVKEFFDELLEYWKANTKLTYFQTLNLDKNLKDIHFEYYQQQRIKSWGSEFIYFENKHNSIKVLEFNPGCNGSLHYHVEKTEAWMFFGEFEVLTINKENCTPIVTRYSKYDKLILYPGKIHQVRSCDINISGILEISTTDKSTDTYRVTKDWFLDEMKLEIEER